MEKIKPGMLYIAADGDGIGKLVGRAVIANDVEELHKVSNRIDAAQDFILHWCKNVDGIKISGGGDEATMAIPEEAKKEIEGLRKSIEKSFGYTISVGVGRNLSEAGTALLVAKLRGKDRIVWFNKKIKEDIKKAKRRVREGRASQEEYKLSEAYLKKAEDMGKTCDLHKGHEKGVHEPLFAPAKATTRGIKTGQGMSSMGYNVRNPRPGMVDPKEKAQKTLKQLRGMKSPDLGKKEHTCSLHKHEEGFHDGAADKEGKGFQHPDQEDNRTDDCNYCQDLDAQENADGSAGMHDCDMCNDYNAKNGTTEGMDDCSACKEYDASQQNTGGIDTDSCPYCEDDNALDNSNPDGCEMCDEYNAAQGTKDLENISGAQKDPQNFQDVDHICNCPNCPKHDSTALEVQDMAAERPDDCPQCQEMYQDAVEEEPGQTAQEDPNMQGHETAEEVLDLLDQKPGQGDQTPESEAKKIDNTELPQGDEMKDGASVPENFGDKQKSDVSDAEKDMQNSDHECNCPDCPGSQQEESPIDRMASPDYQGTQGDVDQMAQESGQESGQDMAQSGQNPEMGQQSGQDPMTDGQDEPDMAGVLQSGLDDHANEQKKAQVLDMVGQTLAGFKANKASLEATKEQNQPLYNSCIQMLKSMIELCKLLGLEPQMNATAPVPSQESPEKGPTQAAEGPSDPKAVG